jgi:hypothetical protein
MVQKIRKKKGVMVMTNEIIKKCIGKNCILSNGSFGASVIGKIVDVNENWVEIETKKGNQLINIEYVQSIKVNP